ADRTWVIFTTPYCASCGPVEDQLRAADPQARLVRVDATRDVDLAGAFRVRTAPTAVLADGDGTVQAKLIGAAAVSRYLMDNRR
ncbi:MAG: thioredoxin family protein, partial [Actinomycetota bacterium]|nr:thioredoxin family protein [Actinomycetota bacterium]